mgnify:CR=1 FL=1
MVLIRAANYLAACTNQEANKGGRLALQYKESGDINRFGLAMQVSDERNRALVIERKRNRKHRERERETRRTEHKRSANSLSIERERERVWI